MGRPIGFIVRLLAGVVVSAVSRFTGYDGGRGFHETRRDARKNKKPAGEGRKRRPRAKRRAVMNIVFITSCHGRFVKRGGVRRGRFDALAPGLFDAARPAPKEAVVEAPKTREDAPQAARKPSSDNFHGYTPSDALAPPSRSNAGVSFRRWRGPCGGRRRGEGALRTADGARTLLTRPFDKMTRMHYNDTHEG
jgi:hypothetical protein